MSVDPNRLSGSVSGRKQADPAEVSPNTGHSSSGLARLFEWVRLTLRISSITLWTSLMFFLWSPVSLVLSLKESWDIEWRQFMFGIWAKGFLKIIGGKVEVNGNPPDDPFFLVSNHLSYIDIPVLGTQLNTSFVAKQEIAGWPVIGFLTRLLDTIFVDRDDCFDLPRVNDRIAKRVEAGDGVVVFPEGTSTSGRRVRPFNSPLLEYPAQSDEPVHFASLNYTTPLGQTPAESAICYWGDMQFGPHFMNLLKLPGFKVTINFSSEPVRGTCRKELAAQLEYSVKFLRSGTNHRERINSVSSVYRFDG